MLQNEQHVELNDLVVPSHPPRLHLTYVTDRVLARVHHFFWRAYHLPSNCKGYGAVAKDDSIAIGIDRTKRSQRKGLSLYYRNALSYTSIDVGLSEGLDKRSDITFIMHVSCSDESWNKVMWKQWSIPKNSETQRSSRPSNMLPYASQCIGYRRWRSKRPQKWNSFFGSKVVWNA